MTSRPSRRGCARSSSRASGFARRVVTDAAGPRRAGRRAVQAGADRAQGQRAGRGGGRRAGRGRPGRRGHPQRHRGQRRGGRRGRRRRADHLRQRRPQDRRAVLEGPVPRPAPAHHPADPGVQADAHRRRLLARQREEPAAPADLRHRLGVPRGAGRLPGTAGRGREARPPQARRRARPVLVPDRDRQRAGRLPPQGRPGPARSWRTTRGSGTRTPATSSSTPRTSPSPSCSRSRATWTGSARTSTRPWSSRAPSTTSSP